MSVPIKTYIPRGLNIVNTGFSINHSSASTDQTPSLRILLAQASCRDLITLCQSKFHWKLPTIKVVVSFKIIRCSDSQCADCKRSALCLYNDMVVSLKVYSYACVRSEGLHVIWLTIKRESSSNLNFVLTIQIQYSHSILRHQKVCSSILALFTTIQHFTNLLMITCRSYESHCLTHCTLLRFSVFPSFLNDCFSSGRMKMETSTISR